MAKSLSGVSPALLLFTACSFWGIATVLNKVLLGSIPPVLLLFLQLFASAVVLWTACLVARMAMPRGKVLWGAVGLGVLNPGISYTLSLMGLERISASVSSLLWASEPFLILGLAWLILREPVTPRLVAVIASGFAGVVLVSGLIGGAGAGQSDAWGIGLLFGAVLMCAVYTVGARKLGEGADALALVSVQQTAGLAWAALLLAVTPGDGMAAIAAVPAPDLILAMLTGLLYYAAAYWLYLSALNRVSAALAGGSFNIIPMVTIAVAFVFLGERLSGVQVAGAALIMVSAAALFWLTRGEDAARRPATRGSSAV